MACSICSESIDYSQSVNLKYTPCCSEPICDHCQDDLSRFSDTIECLVCSKVIKPSTLIDPIALITARFDSELQAAENLLKPFINQYIKASDTLTQHLLEHYANISQLRADLDCAGQPGRSDLDQTNSLILQNEQYRVIKPIMITIQDNTAVLTSLTQLVTKLHSLNSERPTLVQHGRLIQLNDLITAAIQANKWPPPSKMVISNLWYCRHPLGGKLVSTQALTYLTTGGEWHENVISLDTVIAEMEQIYKQRVRSLKLTWSGQAMTIKRVKYQEISPEVFILIITTEIGWVFICRPDLTGTDSTITCYLTNCRANSVRVSANHLVYQDSQSKPAWDQDDPAEVIVYEYNFTQTADQTPAKHNPGELSGITVTTILTLEPDQLWCYDTISQELRCYQLGSSRFALITVISTATVLNYHSGIYCTRHQQSARSGQTSRTFDVANYPKYYRINSIKYPQAAIETTQQPRLFCDGSVAYYAYKQADKVCYREDLTQARMLGYYKLSDLSDKLEINSAGQLICYFVSSGQKLVVRVAQY